MRKGSLAGYGLAVGLAFSAAELAAQEVTLQTDHARSALRAASLLLALEDDAVPQDYVAAARADYRRLLTALYAEGYYSGAVSITLDGVEAAGIAPLAAPRSIGNVVISVDTGERFTFGAVSIAPLPQGTTLETDLGPREVARSGLIEDAVRGAIASWRDVGYAKVSVQDQSVVARHNANELDVSIRLAPGPRLRFGNLVVSGNETVTDARIRQIAGLPVGDVFSPAEIAAAERRLRRTGTFESVSLTEAELIGPEDTLAINAQIVEAKPRRIGAGAEISSIEGLTLSGYWLHRNFLGGAERFRLDAEISGIAGETGGTDYRLAANFTRPAVFGPDTEYFLQGEILREDEEDYLIDKISVETGFSRIITEDLTVRAGVGLLRAREVVDGDERAYTLLTLPLDATYDRRNDPANATEGYFIDVSATPFIGIDGDLAGARTFADLRGYLTFGETDNFTIAGRGQVGAVFGAEIDEAPVDYLLYSGGGGTVRGQPYRSLGVTTMQGMDTVTTGGLSFIGAQLEARYLVRENISVVGFYDWGYVGETSTPGTEGDWHAGTGLGVRYNTGIGPIRLDLGTPASGDKAFEELQVYIGIGQAF